MGGGCSLPWRKGEENIPEVFRNLANDKTKGGDEYTFQVHPVVPVVSAWAAEGDERIQYWEVVRFSRFSTIHGKWWTLVESIQLHISQPSQEHESGEENSRRDGKFWSVAHVSMPNLVAERYAPTGASTTSCSCILM